VRALPPTLSLHGVAWRAGPDEPWLLKDLDLQVAAGEHLALTGPSGGGKSTLLMLMLGLLAPTEGEVRYGGVPLARLDAAAWRACVGSVLQDDLLLAGSLLQNVAFFDPAPAPARLAACAALAGLGPLLGVLPMGWRTPLGEGGQGLSGGQRQRLLLARALYPRPRLLVLDEATSHLDLAAEREVVAALSRLRLTRIAVAHRPETLRHADRCLVLHGGRLHPA
jgi:ATP-binding cassette subfamily B protein RaxB